MPGVRPRRAAQEAVQSMAEPSSELSLQDDGNDSDEEAVPKPAGRGRKRKGVDAGGSSKRGKGPGKGRGRAAAAQGVGDEDEGSGSLFEIVKAGRASLATVVDDWIENYKQDRDNSLLELIQFFIQCSGCKGKITPYMYANMEHAEIIRKMTEEFDEESGDYPLIQSGPQWKKFKANYCDFVQVLVRQCQYSIIYDQYMMDNVISLLTGLTDSQVRAFRHTSTLAAMKLMTALVDVALNLSINLDNTQRQYESERQKNKNKQASERLNLLLVKRQELEENQAEIRNMLTYIFKGVFVHRYRDTQAEIRSICMKEIGVWMKKYPNMFLDDGYLKYVGWTLYDKQGDVRSCCLKALYPLYETTDLCHKLEYFTSRFKDRIVEMTLDKETEVAVQAVKLVISILNFGDSVLTDKDCENVYELVYSSHRQVAQAAGEFLNAKLFRRDDEESNAVVKTAKGKKRSLNTPLVRDLVQFFIESELHEHGAYLVDSLWEINAMMKDWECMTDLLLEEAGKGEEALDDRQETSLIEIMVCCVKQAATGESPVGRGTQHKKLTPKEKQQVRDDKTKLTEHFIITLPQLLLKYLMDPEKVTNLLQIPQYFDLEIYTSSRQEKNLEGLLRYLHEIVEKHTDQEVLEACSKCFECLCSEEYAISGKCDVARKTLIDSLVVKFKEAMQDYFAEGEQPDEDEIYALIAALKRLYAFSCCHDLSSWDLWEDLFHIVKLGAENIDMADEIVCKAQTTIYNLIIWNLHQLEETYDQNHMQEIKKFQTNLLRYCNQLLDHTRDPIAEEAYLTICDSLVIFSKNMGTHNQNLKLLVVEPEKTLQARLSSFLMDKVFLEDDDGECGEQAYLTICDSLVIFSKNMGTHNQNLKLLVVEPEKTLQARLSSFLMDKVFLEDDDEEVDENIKIEELHKRRNFLACFCKLVVYNILNIKVAAPMFKHYMKFYNDYGDIIKATLSKAREINKVVTAKTLVMSLTQLFKELQDEQGGNIDRSSDAFQSIKELARRFSLSFGLDQVRNREAVAAMHRDGIIYSITNADPNDISKPPPNISFLEVLCEFTNKLMKQDKKTVLTYLDKQLAGVPPIQRNSDDWQALLTYRNSLVQGEHEIHPITLKQAAQRRYGKRKNVNIDGTIGDESNENWDGTGATPAHMGVPQHTSTALKRKRMDEESNPSEQGSEADYQESSRNRRRSRRSSRRKPAGCYWNRQDGPHRAQQETTNYGQRHQQDNMPHLEPESSEGNISEFDSPQMSAQQYHSRHHQQQQQQQQMMYEEGSQNIDDASRQHAGVIQPMQQQGHHPPPALTPHPPQSITPLPQQAITPLPPPLTPHPPHTPLMPHGHMTPQHMTPHSHMVQSPMTPHSHMVQSPLTPQHPHTPLSHMPHTPQNLGQGHASDYSQQGH